jgi:hypothetical protein
MKNCEGVETRRQVDKHGGEGQRGEQQGSAPGPNGSVIALRGHAFALSARARHVDLDKPRIDGVHAGAHARCGDNSSA